MREHYTLEALESMPTLCTGQTADLKVENGAYRVWVSRCVDEGEAPIMVETYNGRRWEETATGRESITIDTE